MKFRHLYWPAARHGSDLASTLSLPEHLPPGTYQTWIETFDTLDDEATGNIRSELAALRQRPKISVIMPVYNPPPEMLRDAIESVRGQLYEDWSCALRTIARRT